MLEAQIWTPPYLGAPEKENYSNKSSNCCKVSAKLIYEKGFSATSINGIASILGFNKDALQYYCRNSGTGYL